MDALGVTNKQVLPTAAKIESSVRNLDTIAKYAQGWFGIFELPNMPGLSTPVKNLNKVFRAFIDWNKGTYGAITRVDDWLPDANGKSGWNRKGVIERVTLIFMSFVSCFDVVGLFQTITGGAKLGVVAKSIQNGAFLGGMTFTIAGYLDPLKKAHAEKSIIERKVTKWKEREKFISSIKAKDSIERVADYVAEKVKKYEERLKEIPYEINELKEKMNKANELVTKAKSDGKEDKAANKEIKECQEKLKILNDKLVSMPKSIERYESDSFNFVKNNDNSYTAVREHAEVKMTMWQKKLILAKNDVRGKWFDIAKTVAKAVQLVFALFILALGTVAVPVLIADAVVKFTMGHFAMASLLNKEFRPDIDKNYLPKNLK